MDRIKSFFRIVFTIEEKEELKKPFHNALHKSDRNKKSLMRKRFKFQGFTFQKDEVKAPPVS
jgi:hypothetical protein